MRKLLIILTSLVILGIVAGPSYAATSEHPLMGKWTWDWSGWYGKLYQTWDTTLIITAVSADGTLEGEMVAVLNAGQPNQREYRQPLAAFESAKAMVKNGLVMVDIKNERARYTMAVSPDGQTLSGSLTKPHWEGEVVFKKQQ